VRWLVISEVGAGVLGADNSVVQVARGLHDELDYNLTFFLSPSLFDDEKRLFASPTLRGHLPLVDVLGDLSVKADAIVDTEGYALPPCVVIEKGEALNEWARRRSPGLQAKAEVCTLPSCSRHGALTTLQVFSFLL
jgi:hypothetical protein